MTPSQPKSPVLGWAPGLMANPGMIPMRLAPVAATALMLTLLLPGPAVGGIVADLSVVKSGAPDPVAPGETIEYQITVGNSAPQATNVTLSDTLPPGTTFVSLTSPPGWTSSTPAMGATGTVTSSISPMPMGFASFQLVVRVDASVADGTMITNTATVVGSDVDPDATNNSSTATTTVSTSAPFGPADFATTMAFPTTVLPGENITYAITVENLGPSPSGEASMGGPKFVGPIPEGTTFVSFTAPAGWTTTVSLPVGEHGCCGLEARTPSLAVSTPQVFTLIVRVDPTLPDGSVLSSVFGAGSITVDPDMLNNQYTATTTVLGPGASLPGGDRPEPGLNVPLAVLGFAALLVGLLTTAAVLAVRRRRI